MKKRAQLEYKILRHHQVYGTPINDESLPKWMQKIKGGKQKPVITKNRRGILKNVHKNILEKRRLRYQKNKEKIKANETPAAKEKRLAYSRERMRALYKSAKTANETPEQREERLKVSRLRSLKRFESETEEQRAKRRENAKIYQKNKIANETVEQYRIRIMKNRVSFQNRFERKSKKTVNYEIEPADIEIIPSTPVDEVEPFNSLDVKPLIPFDMQPPSPVDMKPSTSSDVSTSSRPKRYKKAERSYNFSSEIVLIRESARNEADDQFIKEEPEDYEDTELSQDSGEQKESRARMSFENPTFEYDLDVSVDAPENNRSLRTRKTKALKESSEEDNDSNSDFVDPFKSSHLKQSATQSDEKSDE